MRENKKRKKAKSGKKTALVHLDKIDWTKTEKLFETDKKLLIQSQAKDKDNKRYPHAKEILVLLAGGLMLGLLVFLPTLPMALAPFILDSKKYQKKRLNQTINRLKKQKLVKIVEKSGQIIVKITDKGRVRALQYKFGDMKIDKPKTWDRKWRIVIFDIPEKCKRVRDLFRSHLKTMGFFNLQESVWVHPYPCFEQIEYLRQIYGVAINVDYILAQKIEESDDLVAHFKENRWLS